MSKTHDKMITPGQHCNFTLLHYTALKCSVGYYTPLYSSALHYTSSYSSPWSSCNNIFSNFTVQKCDGHCSWMSCPVLQFEYQLNVYIWISICCRFKLSDFHLVASCQAGAKTQTDIATYRLNRTRGQIIEKVFDTFCKLPPSSSPLSKCYDRHPNRALVWSLIGGETTYPWLWDSHARLFKLAH